MFWKVLRYVFMPSSGLEENKIKGAFSPTVPLALFYPIYIHTQTHTMMQMIAMQNNAIVLKAFLMGET